MSEAADGRVRVGFSVSSLAVLRKDEHGLFLTFVPARRMRYQSVNEWVYRNFFALAQRVGPEAALVAPANGRGYRDFPDLNIGLHGRAQSILHSGFPMLIVTRAPLSVRDRESDALVINLAAMADDRGVANLFDELIAASKRPLPDKLSDLAITVPSTDLSSEYDQGGGWSHAFAEAVHLKPNIFGFGVNLNSLLEWWADRRSKKRQLDDVILHLDGS